MKTAVLISGQARSLAACLANLNWQVFRRLENPTIFASVADDEQSADAYLLESLPYPVHVERVTQPTLPEPPFSLCKHAPYAPTPNNASVIQPILRQLWHYKRVWEFARENSINSVEVVGDVAAKDSVPDFDVFVRCRPDLFFHRFDNPFSSLGVRPYDNGFVGPWKSTCGGVNDRFSLMGPEAAVAYFNALDVLPALLKTGCPLHPESIQQAALERAGCTIANILTAEFTCMRLPGHGDHVPLMEYPGELARYLKALT